jgi:fatty acid desaturase
MIDDAPVRFTSHDLPRETLRALMARTDGSALRRAAGHLGALALTGTLLWRLRATAWAVPLLIAHGYVLAFVFCIFHETAHRTAFRTRWLNTALGTLAGLLIVWPYRNYRVYHWEHHRFTQDEARDPELYFAKPASLAAYLLVLTGVPNLVRRLSDLLRLARGRADRPWMSAAEGPALVVEARAYLAVYAAVALASVVARSPVAVVVWIVPLLAGQVFLRPYLLAEHTACASTRDCLENNAHHPHLAAGAFLRLEHAVSRRAPRVPGRALPRAPAPARAREDAPRQPRARLHRGHPHREP